MDLTSLKKYEKDIYLCATCRDGGCGTLCPSFEVLGFESYTPRGRMRIARGLIEGRIDITESVKRNIYTCTDCGTCAVRCSLKVHEVMEAFRAAFIEAGKAHSHLAEIAESMKTNHNPAFKAHETRSDWLPEELRTPRKADVLFFVGCYASHHTQWMAKTVVKILDKAGVKWTTLGLDEWCCGEVPVQLGMPDLADMHMRHNIEAINSAVKNLGVSRVVCQCPGCSNRLKSQPRHLGLTLNAEVLHVTEFYEELLKAGKIRFKESKRTYVYHDACLLGRWQGVYEAPRSIIRAIPEAKLVEMGRRVRDFSQCCTGSTRRWGGTPGYGVPLIKSQQDYRDGLVNKRLNAAKESGADTLVSACGGCHRAFVQGKNKIERTEREGLDLVLISTLVEDLII